MKINNQQQPIMKASAVIMAYNGIISGEIMAIINNGKQ